MSDNESESGHTNNSGRDLEEWVIVNQQNANDSDTNDEEPTHIHDICDQIKDQLTDDESDQEVKIYGELTPSCSKTIEESVHSTVSDCSLIFNREEKCDQETQIETSSSQVTAAVNNSFHSSLENEDENDSIPTEPECKYDEEKTNVSDDKKRRKIIIFTVSFLCALLTTVFVCLYLFNNNNRVGEPTTLFNCKSNLHQKLRELASCKSSNDFCESSDKPSCPYFSDISKTLSEECQKRLDGMANDMTKLAETRERLLSEIESLGSNLTAILLAYSNLLLSNKLEADWLRQTNDLLTGQLRRAARRVVQSRRSAHSSRRLLVDLENRLVGLENTIEELKSKPCSKPNFQRSTYEYESDTNMDNIIKSEEINKDEGKFIWEFLNRIKHFRHWRQPTIMNLYTTMLIRTLEPKQRLDDLARFTTTIFNESVSNLNRFYDTVVQKSSSNLENIKTAIWNESCTAFNKIYFTLQNSSDLSNVFDTVQLNLGHLWEKSSNFEWWDRKEKDKDESETSCSRTAEPDLMHTISPLEEPVHEDNLDESEKFGHTDDDEDNSHTKRFINSHVEEPSLESHIEEPSLKSHVEEPSLESHDALNDSSYVKSKHPIVQILLYHLMRRFIKAHAEERVSEESFSESEKFDHKDEDEDESDRKRFIKLREEEPVSEDDYGRLEFDYISNDSVEKSKNQFADVISDGEDGDGLEIRVQNVESEYGYDESDLQHPSTDTVTSSEEDDNDTNWDITNEKWFKMNDKSEVAVFLFSWRQSSIGYHLGRIEYARYLALLWKCWARDKIDLLWWPCQKNWWVGRGHNIEATISNNDGGYSKLTIDCLVHLEDWQKRGGCEDSTVDFQRDCNEERRRTVLEESPRLDRFVQGFAGYTPVIDPPSHFDQPPSKAQEEFVDDKDQNMEQTEQRKVSAKVKIDTYWLFRSRQSLRRPQLERAAGGGPDWLFRRYRSRQSLRQPISAEVKSDWWFKRTKGRKVDRFFSRF